MADRHATIANVTNKTAAIMHGNGSASVKNVYWI